MSGTDLRMSNGDCQLNQRSKMQNSFIPVTSLNPNLAGLKIGQCVKKLTLTTIIIIKR